MSHFLMGVFIPKEHYELADISSKEEFESLTETYVTRVMEPYEESPEPGSPYLVFHDVTEERINDYLMNEQRIVVLTDGTKIIDLASLTRPATPKEEGYLRSLNAITKDTRTPEFSHIITFQTVYTTDNEVHFMIQAMPEGAHFENMMTRQACSFASYLQSYYYEGSLVDMSSEGFSSFCPDSQVTVLEREIFTKVWRETDNVEDIRRALEQCCTVGYYCNDNARWDYWDFGWGRGKGMIPTRNGQRVIVSPLYNINLRETFTEQDIQDLHRFWEINVEEQTPTQEEKDSHKFVTFYSADHYKQFYGTVEEFIEDKRWFVPFSYITQDEELIEPGRMGWWALTDETPESRKRYKQQFKEHFMQSDPEDIFVVLDCHI